MSILNGTKEAGAPAGPNPWAGKVRAVGVTAPWWHTESVIGVCEVSVSGAAGPVFTVLVSVIRSAKSGRLFANMPTTKRGDEWLPQVTIDDAQLGKAIEAVAVAAVQGWEAQGGAETPAGDDNGLPF